MQGREETWVLVMNGEFGQVSAWYPRHAALQAIETFQAAVHSPCELSSVGSGRQAMEPPRDLKDLHQKQRFLASILSYLERARRAERFHHLVVMAPPKMLGLFRQLLPTTLAPYIELEVAKDLTKERPDMIAVHLNMLTRHAAVGL